MDYNAIPRLRFEIEGIKSQITAHLGLHGSELGDAINKEIDKAVKSYDFEGQVRHVVYTCLTNKIREYFETGDGKLLIESAIKESLDKIFSGNHNAR